VSILFLTHNQVAVHRDLVLICRNQQATDPRIGIIFEVLSLLQVSGASHLLIECVDGMIYHRNKHVNGDAGEILKIALRIITDLGYAFSINVHQAAAYGTPQNRKRMFIWAAKLGAPLPTPPTATHHGGSPSVVRFGKFELQPVSRAGPLHYLTQQDAVSDLPHILTAEERAFAGEWRSQFYGFWEGAKSYSSPPTNNYQLAMRDYDLGGRVQLQYCHVPTETTYRKMLTEMEADMKGRKKLPGTFPCVTTGGLVPHPTQRRSFSARERLRAQGFPDCHDLRFGELSEEDLIKEYDFVSGTFACSL
jgi:site-specific DNA-cytosine methylase